MINSQKYTLRDHVFRISISTNYVIENRKWTVADQITDYKGTRKIRAADHQLSGPFHRAYREMRSMKRTGAPTD
jgi:hypothetical protein